MSCVSGSVDRPVRLFPTVIVFKSYVWPFDLLLILSFVRSNLGKSSHFLRSFDAVFLVMLLSPVGIFPPLRESGLQSTLRP